MRRIATLVILSVAAASSVACNFTGSRESLVSLQDLTLEAPYDQVWRASLRSMEQCEIPIRSAKDGRIRSRKIRDRGVSWRLYVELTESREEVIVRSYIEAEIPSSVEPDFDFLFSSDAEKGLKRADRRLKEGRYTKEQYRRKRAEIEPDLRQEEESASEEKEERDRKRAAPLLSRARRRGEEFQRRLCRILGD